MIDGYTSTMEEFFTGLPKEAMEDQEKPILLTEETARKIWDAGVEYGQFSIHGGSPAPPDFETFYKQLIEGK